MRRSVITGEGDHRGVNNPGRNNIDPFWRNFCSNRAGQCLDRATNSRQRDLSGFHFARRGAADKHDTAIVAQLRCAIAHDIAIAP